jgi:predicted transcriptional regulator
MSKITFRADDDLVRQLEEYDASKSEVMREALRMYLGEPDVNDDAAAVNSGLEGAADEDSVEDLLADRVDAIVADRLGDALTASEPQDVNVNITLDGDSAGVTRDAPVERKTAMEERPESMEDDAGSCKQCGEELGGDDVYCSNCGAKASHRLFCECGDELRSDWGFCPSCGRRTPAADVLRDP